MLCSLSLLICLLVVSSQLCAAQLSDPHHSDEQKDEQGNKYLQRQATEDDALPLL